MIYNEDEGSRITLNAQQNTSSRPSILPNRTDVTTNQGQPIPTIIEPIQESNVPSERTDRPISEVSISPTLSPTRTPRRNSDSTSASASHSNPTLPLNHSVLEMPKPLRQQLDEAKQQISKSDFSWIIPKCQLDAIITYENVVSDISLKSPNLSSDEVRTYAAIVVEKAKSLYASLVLSNRNASVQELLDEEISDADLPLMYWRPEKKQPGSGQTSFSTSKGKLVTSFEAWHEDYKLKFAERQWSTLVKVFDLGGHYELHKNDLLPFTPLEECEDVHKHGAYGKVYPARIHPSHHKFKLNVSKNIQCTSDPARLMYSKTGVPGIGSCKRTA
jgi:hypothetical protein